MMLGKIYPVVIGDDVAMQPIVYYMYSSHHLDHLPENVTEVANEVHEVV